MRTFLRLVTVALCLAAVGPSHAAVAPDGTQRPCRPAQPDERFSVDYKDVSLQTVTRLVACAAGLNIIFKPQSLGARQVTVVAPRSVDLPALRALFDALLHREGLIIETRGGYHLIRQATDQRPSKTRSSSGR